ADLTPSFLHSSAASSSVMRVRRSSKETERGMMTSPGEFSSIQALILGRFLFFWRMKSRSERLMRKMTGLAVRRRSLLTISTWKQLLDSFPSIQQLRERKIIRLASFFSDRNFISTRTALYAAAH